MEYAGHPQFTALYEEHKGTLFTYLMYRVNFNKPLAEDLFMDIVLKSYEHFSKFDANKGSFKTWIFTIAHHHLINHWRDHREAISLEALQDQGVTPGTSDSAASVAVEEGATGEQIQKILSLLDEEERAVIALRFLNEMDFSEIASLIQKKEGAVRTRLSRALQRFKQYYNKLYPNI